MSTARADVYTYDAGGELFDWTTWGAVTVFGPATPYRIAAYMTVGDSKFEGRLIVLVDQISVGHGDERYDVSLQGSETPDFASVEVLALLAFGASAVRPGGAVTSGPGKFESRHFEPAAQHALPVHADLQRSLRHVAEHRVPRLFGSQPSDCGLILSLSSNNGEQHEQR